MSGGSYNYAYSDAEKLQRTLKEMEKDALSDDDLPENIGEAFYDMRKAIDPELLRQFEWYKSGDISADEVGEGLGWI